MGQEGPQPVQAVAQSSAGAQGSGQRRGFAWATAQIDRPLQLGTESLADVCGGGLQLSAADLLVEPLMPAVKQLPLQAEQRLADLSGNTAALSDGDQIAADVGPAELALHQRQAVVGTVAITDQDAEESFTDQLLGGRFGAAEPQLEHRYQRIAQHPHPATAAVGVVAIRIAHGVARFIRLQDGLPLQPEVGFFHRLLQKAVEPAAEAADAAGAVPYAKSLVQQALDLEMAEMKGATQHSHQGREARAIATALHIGGQHGTGSALAAGADPLVQAVFHHDRRHRRDVDDLVAPWLSTGSRPREARSAAAAVVGDMVEPLIAALRWQQITAMARMPLLAAPLTALAIAFAATETTAARSALSGSVAGG